MWDGNDALGCTAEPAAGPAAAHVETVHVKEEMDLIEMVAATQCENWWNVVPSQVHGCVLYMHIYGYNKKTRRVLQSRITSHLQYTHA